MNYEDNMLLRQSLDEKGTNFETDVRIIKLSLIYGPIDDQECA